MTVNSTVYCCLRSCADILALGSRNENISVRAPRFPGLLSKNQLLCSQATVRSALETGTLDLEGKGLTSLPPGLFQDGRTLSAVTRAKLSANKLQVIAATLFW